MRLVHACFAPALATTFLSRPPLIPFPSAALEMRVSRRAKDPRPEDIVDYHDHHQAPHVSAARCRAVGDIAKIAGDVDGYQTTLDELERAAQTRFVAAPGNRDAREYLLEKLRGMTGEFDRVEDDAFTYAAEEAAPEFVSMDRELETQTVLHNVYAIKRGTEHPEEYVVLAAHYDSVNWEGIRKKGASDPTGAEAEAAPGADDNGSGVVAVLRAAEALQATRLKRSVVFIFFTGEEEGLLGSQHWVVDDVATRYGLEKNVGTIILDQVGFDAKAKGSAILETVGDTAANNRVMDAIAQTGCADRPLAGDLSFVSNYHGFDSDHIPFLKANIPTILMIERDNEAYDDLAVHSARDIEKNVDATFGAKMAARAAVGAFSLAEGK